MRGRLTLLAVSAAMVATIAFSSACRTTGDAADPTNMFAPVARVLRHARCLNCHPVGDRPRVGDDARIHPQGVMRGPDGHGLPAMKCASCHQPANQDLAGVPGAPHWHLAPRSMGWEGLDDHALANAITDRGKNGGRSLAGLRKHLAEDPLVLWGWDPGAGRAAVPMPHPQFLAAFDAWVAAGAPAPEPGTTSTF